MSERLMEYLEVDPETVEPYTPEWPVEAVLRPVPEAAELLPHLAHMLAPVRVRGSSDPTADTPIALATSPWMNHEESDSDADGVPIPGDTPISWGTAVLTPDSYESRLARTTTARGEIRVVALTDSAERARRLRRALPDPEVPGGVGEWEVISSPDADTVTAVLSDPEIDIAYCGLPVEDGRITAADGAVSLDGLGGAPALAVFEGAVNPVVGDSIVENGGLSSILTEGTLSPGLFRSLIGLLSFGVPTAASVTLSGVEAETRTRIVGDPGVEIASHGHLVMQVNWAWSESLTTHRIERGSALSLSGRVGIEQSQLFDGFQPMNELSGRVGISGPTLDSSDLLALLNQGETVVRLNGRLVLPEDVETEADIEELARRYLSGDGEPAERVCESRSE